MYSFSIKMWLQTCGSKCTLNWNARCHTVLTVGMHNEDDSECLDAGSFTLSAEMLCLGISNLSGLRSISSSPDGFFHFHGLPQMYYDITCSTYLMQWEEGEIEESYIPFLVSQKQIAVWANDGEWVEKREGWQISCVLTWESGGAISTVVMSPWGNLYIFKFPRKKVFHILLVPLSEVILRQNIPHQL